jgi:DNA-binding transcriptional regulator LsrR (DeoR family)
MEEVYVVRHRHLVEGVPIRQIAREMGIDRNTVRRYVRDCVIRGIVIAETAAS